MSLQELIMLHRETLSNYARIMNDASTIENKIKNEPNKDTKKRLIKQYGEKMNNATPIEETVKKIGEMITVVKTVADPSKTEENKNKLNALKTRNSDDYKKLLKQLNAELKHVDNFKQIYNDLMSQDCDKKKCNQIIDEILTDDDFKLFCNTESEIDELHKKLKAMKA
jgi:hypothetical protein